MEAEWTETTLGGVLTLQRGFDLPVQDRVPGHFPVVASNGVVGWHSKAAVVGPGVVIGRSGSIGGAQFLTDNFWPLNTTLWVKDFKGNDPYFCFALLRSIDFQQFNAGSGVPTLNRNHVHPIPVRVPPQSEQKSISSVLRSLDDRIDYNRALAAGLEAIARRLFKSWFVDFDPVRAKAAGEKHADLADDLAALFPDRFVDSELGEVPEGWSVTTLGEAFDLNPKRTLAKGTMAPYLDMANTPTIGHVPDQIIHRAFSSGSKFINGDTLLARITPCLENGKAAFVDFLGDASVGWGSTEFIVMRPKAKLPEYFGYLLARYEPFKAHAIASMSGTSGRQRVQLDSLATWELVLPSEAVAMAFGQIVEPMRAVIASASEEVRVLGSIRDLLLPRLISGKLRVADAESLIEEAIA